MTYKRLYDFIVHSPTWETDSFSTEKFPTYWSMPWARWNQSHSIILYL